MRRLAPTIGAVAAICALVPVSVSAQDKAQPAVKKPKGEPKWTLEVHGGLMGGATPANGAGAQFPAGDLLMTDVGFNTRTNPSWFFGGGAALFNDVRGQFASRFNINFAQIASLDSMLTSAVGKRKGGPEFGFRLGRQISKRFGIEFGFDRSQGTVTVTDGARTSIESARASFESGFTGLIQTIPQLGIQVTSTADIGEADVTQTSITGALTISLVDRGRFKAHALAGGGTIASGGDDLAVRLRGNYQFRLFNTYAFNETDNLVIHVNEKDSTAVGVVGGGFTYDVGRRHGVRVDLRALIGGNGMTTTVDATPSSTTGVPAIALPSNTNPSLQFSNMSGVRSSLSGSTNGFTTFTGDGLDTRILFSVGYFIRF